RGEVDVEETGDEIAPVAERDRLADIGEEFELVLDVFRREQRAAAQPADILGAVNDVEMARRVEKSGVAGADIAVAGHRLGGALGILEIAEELARALVENLAVRGDAHLDIGDD